MLLIGNWVRTRQDSVHTAFRELLRNFQLQTSLDLSPIQLTLRMPARQDKTVCVVNVGSVKAQNVDSLYIHMTTVVISFTHMCLDL